MAGGVVVSPSRGIYGLLVAATRGGNKTVMKISDKRVKILLSAARQRAPAGGGLILPRATIVSCDAAGNDSLKSL